MDIKQYLAQPGNNFSLKKFKTDDAGGLTSKEEGIKNLEENIVRMADLQGKLYAQNQSSLLLIFQGMDGSGKDSAIKHVMSGLNPQGTQVYSFKQPSKEEMDHDFLWRINKALPEKGNIGIFNRSHYEEVLIVRVHNLIGGEKIPGRFANDNIWDLRYEQINAFEKYLYENGTRIIKFFLHISKDEQKNRFLKRIDDPARNWKIVEEDVTERRYWDEYQKCYEKAIKATSQKSAPWYVVPGDKKWFARLLISEVIVKTMENINPEYPVINREQKQNLAKIRETLLNEKS
ncbi:MAG: polyphosphate kinase 2 family protein [Ignavibacteria bacterium]